MILWSKMFKQFFFHFTMVTIVIMFATIIFLPAPPRFTSPEKMKRQKIIRPVNSSLRLRCKATGNPRPQISWMKDHQELYSRDSGRRSSWTLRLSDLQQMDSGLYTCVVWNRLGSVNFTYHIEVIGKEPKINVLYERSFLWAEVQSLRIRSLSYLYFIYLSNTFLPRIYNIFRTCKNQDVYLF